VVGLQVAEIDNVSDALKVNLVVSVAEIADDIHPTPIFEDELVQPAPAEQEIIVAPPVQRVVALAAVQFAAPLPLITSSPVCDPRTFSTCLRVCVKLSPSHIPVAVF